MVILFFMSIRVRIGAAKAKSCRNLHNPRDKEGTVNLESAKCAPSLANQSSVLKLQLSKY